VMIADKLFESYLSFKLKVLVAAQSSSSGATGLRAASPSTVTNSTTGCRKTSCSPPSLAYPYTNGKPKSGYCGTAAHVYHHGYQ
jgi:hypothetical protein